MRVWSEQWRSAEDRLADIERALRQDGVPVFASGAFARWDLHSRGGLLGSARLRLGLEEHGGGRQLVRFRISPAVPLGGRRQPRGWWCSRRWAPSWPAHVAASAVLSVIALTLAACARAWMRARGRLPSCTTSRRGRARRRSGHARIAVRET